MDDLIIGSADAPRVYWPKRPFRFVFMAFAPWAFPRHAVFARRTDGVLVVGKVHPDGWENEPRRAAQHTCSACDGSPYGSQ